MGIAALHPSDDEQNPAPMVRNEETKDLAHCLECPTTTIARTTAA